MTPSFARLRAEGRDAQRFLQAQLANQVQDLAIGQWRFGSCCLADGRVLALFMIGRSAESCLDLLLPSELGDLLAKHLQRFRLRSQLTLSLGAVAIDATADLVGSGAYPGTLSTGDDGQTWAGPHFSWHVSSTGTAAPALSARCWEAQAQARIPWLFMTTSARFLPQMLGLQALAAYSLRKGCYPGQEVIARAHFRGAVKRHLVELALTDVAEIALPVSGTEILDVQGTSAGTLLYAIPGSPPRGLAVLLDSRANGPLSAAGLDVGIVWRDADPEDGTARSPEQAPNPG